MSISIPPESTPSEQIPTEQIPTEPIPIISTDAHASQPLRIVIAADTFPPDINGAARFARDHAVRLARRGHEVHVIAPSVSYAPATGDIETIDGEQIRVHRLRSIRLPGHEWARIPPPWQVRRQARRILGTVRPDIVHLQSFVDIGRGVALEAHDGAFPIVATNHVMPDNLASIQGLPSRIVPVLARMAWRLASSVYSRADVVTSPTPIAAGYLERNTAISTVMPISCGIDLTRFSAKHAKPTQPRLLFVGRLDPEKDVATLIRAFARVPLELGTQLDIVGGGSERAALEVLAKQLRIDDRVKFHGRISDEQLEALHDDATVFVMPSTAELQSIATLEAMASGTPVVLADAMALPHLVEDGVEGYLAPAGDDAQFAARITEILDLAEDEYGEMSTHATARASQHEAGAVVRQYEQLYEMVRRSKTTPGYDTVDTPV